MKSNDARQTSARALFLGSGPAIFFSWLSVSAAIASNYSDDAPLLDVLFLLLAIFMAALSLAATGAEASRRVNNNRFYWFHPGMSLVGFGLGFLIPGAGFCILAYGNRGTSDASFVGGCLCFILGIVGLIWLFMGAAQLSQTFEKGRSAGVLVNTSEASLHRVAVAAVLLVGFIVETYLIAVLMIKVL